MHNFYGQRAKKHSIEKTSSRNGIENTGQTYANECNWTTIHKITQCGLLAQTRTETIT